MSIRDALKKYFGGGEESRRRQAIERIKRKYGSQESEDVEELLEEYQREKDGEKGGQPGKGEEKEGEGTSSQGGEEGEKQGPEGEDRGQDGEGQDQDGQSGKDYGGKEEKGKEGGKQGNGGKQGQPGGKQPSGKSGKQRSQGGQGKPGEDGSDDEGDYSQGGEETPGKGKGKKATKGVPGKKGPSREDPTVTELLRKIFKERDEQAGAEPRRYQEPERHDEERRDEEIEEDQETGNMREWNYEKNAFEQISNYTKTELHTPSSADYQHFLEHFEHLVTQIRYELGKMRKTKREKIKGVKKGSRMDPRRTQEEVTRIIGGKDPTGKIYDRRKEQEREYSIGILLDRSGSTRYNASDEYKKIQVEKYTALLLAEAMDELDDEFSIHTFGTKHDGSMTYVEEVKGASEKFTDEIKERIAGIPTEHDERDEGYFSNRDGTAIRVMIDELKKRKTPNKILFLISDGRPNCDEFDRYSGSYALEDTSKAIQEAEQEGIRVVYLSIDPKDDYFRKISEHASFAKSYKEVDELMEEIVGIYKSLTQKRQR